MTKFSHPGGEALTRRLIAHCNIAAGGRVLDFGCGDGTTLALLRDAGFSVAGVDSDKAAINLCKIRDPDFELQRLTNNVLDFPSLSFDAVLAECSLSLVEKRAELLHEIWCILKSGGILGVTDVFQRGAEDVTVAEFERVGFGLRVWEYHTQVLRDYAAQALMDGDGAELSGYGKDTGYFLAIFSKGHLNV